MVIPVQIKSKQVLILLVLAIVFGLFCNQLAFNSTSETLLTPVQAPPPQVQLKLQPKQQLTFYYFHNQRRCKTCLKVEAAISEFVQHSFAKELASGQIRLVKLNAELEQNQPLVKKFNIAFSTLVVALDSEHSQSQWLHFDEVWRKYSDHGNFNRYMASQLQQLVEASQ